MSKPNNTHPAGSAWTHEPPPATGFYWVRGHAGRAVIGWWDARFGILRCFDGELCGAALTDQDVEFWPEALNPPN